MKTDLEQLFNNAKQISLTAEEKNSILNNVIGKIEEEPVRKVTPWRLYKLGGVATLIGSCSPISLMRYRTTLTAFAFMVALLGTTGAYAQISLPGEWLYPIKIHVNEKLEYLSAMTPKAQALLEATFATRRLEEATTLLSTNKLTKSNSTELAAEFSVYTEKLTEHLGELRKNGNGEDANKIDSSFEASIQNHQEILSVLQASSSANENLLHKSDVNDTKKKSPSNEGKEKPSVKIEDEDLAPFVTTPSVTNQDNGEAVNIKETNTVEVPPTHLDNTINVKVESRILKKSQHNSKKSLSNPFE